MATPSQNPSKRIPPRARWDTTNVVILADRRIAKSLPRVPEPTGEGRIPSLDEWRTLTKNFAASFGMLLKVACEVSLAIKEMEARS